MPDPRFCHDPLDDKDLLRECIVFEDSNNEEVPTHSGAFPYTSTLDDALNKNRLSTPEDEEIGRTIWSTCSVDHSRGLVIYRATTKISSISSRKWCETFLCFKHLQLLVKIISLTLGI